jgi:trimeric autotransporter adhesin
MQSRASGFLGVKMALRVISSNSVGVGIRLDLTTADDAVITAGVIIASTDDNRTIEGTGSNHSVQIFGSVFAGEDRAITLGGSLSDSGQRLFIGSTGIVSNTSTGSAAAAVFGSSSVTNFGLIDSTVIALLIGASGANTTTSLINFGTISASSAAVRKAAGTIDTFSMENRGSIIGTSAFISGTSTGVSLITNYGLMRGNIEFGGQSDSYISIGGSLVGTINCGAGLDIVIAGADDDTINGGADIDTIDGGAGNDEIDGGTGDDVMAGGLGDDSFTADAVGDICTDTINGGSDIVRFSGAGTFTLGANIETLTLLNFVGVANGTGNALANTINGSVGSNTLDGAGGSDTLNGSDGSDSYIVDVVTDIVVETNAVLATGGDDLVTFTGSSGTYLLTANVERLTLGGTAAINGTGNALANTIIGNAAANIINGGAGADQMNGGDGNDSYFADLAADSVAESNSVLATGGNDIVTFGGTTGTFILGATVERLTLGGVSAINGTGSVLANTLTGNAAANILTGLGGNDILIGGASLDTLIGGDGSDSYFADLTTDIITEANTVLATGGNDIVTFTGGTGTFILSANVERLVLGGTAAINGTGNLLVNTITGNAAANILNGGAGADQMIGGNGSDSYFADLTTDVVTETNVVLATGGNDLVTFTGGTGTFILSANVERLTLAGAAAINGTGNTLANTIIGNAASNILNGGLANDILTGGAGADFFLFNTAPNTATNRDTITDFNVAADTIQLENAIFTALTTTGALSAAQFKNVTNGGPVDADDRILYDDATGTVSYDRDGSGAAFAAIQFALITGAPTLTQADFVVI